MYEGSMLNKRLSVNLINSLVKSVEKNYIFYLDSSPPHFNIEK